MVVYKIIPILALILFISFSSFSQTTIYSENFGSGAITGFPSGWTSVGTNSWYMSSSTPSTGYTGSSGGHNLHTGSSNSNVLVFSSISTVGYSTVSVIWGGYKSNTLLPAPTFEWSSDSITWHAVTYTNVSSASTWQLVNGGVPISLPSSAAGITNLRFRWTATAILTLFQLMDDFTLTGNPSTISPPVKIAFLSINGGINPDSCYSFNVVVQSRDINNIPANVTSATSVILSKLTGNGTGSLIGGTGSIQSGSNIDTITVSYSRPETGISLLATASALVSDTSNLFRVARCSATLPACYAWDTSGGNTIPFPPGWYGFGMGSPYIAGHIAPNCGKFDSQGDSLLIIFNSTPSYVNYSLRGIALSGNYQFDILESPDGHSYSTVNSYTTINNSWVNFSSALASTSRFVKFVYSVQASGNIAIDDICVLPPPQSPTKLAIISINNGINPDSCHSFKIIVQSQDLYGVPSNIALFPEMVTLSQNTGTPGSLNALAFGVIQAGSDTVSIMATYNNAEPGVSIIASGSTLAADTSWFFTVRPCNSPNAAVLPSCYAWDVNISGNMLPYPTGWNDGGSLGFYITGNTAANSGKFDNQSDSLIIFYNPPADSLVFFLKGDNLSTPYQFDVMESSNGVNYSLLYSYTNLGSSWQMFALNPASTSNRIKFVYTQQSSGNVAIDDICLFPPPQTATKIAIISINNGSSPDSCTAFNIVVQSQDANGVPSNVSTFPAAVTLSQYTGTPGSLGGTILGTINIGSNSTSLNVTYHKVENGVSLIATSILLAGDTSSFFNVTSCLTNIRNNGNDLSSGIFPNPAKTVLFFKNAETIEKVDIINIYGRKLRTENLNIENSSIRIENLEKGLYFLNVYKTNKIQEKFKFVKE